MCFHTDCCPWCQNTMTALSPPDDLYAAVTACGLVGYQCLYNYQYNYDNKQLLIQILSSRGGQCENFLAHVLTFKLQSSTSTEPTLISRIFFCILKTILRVIIRHQLNNGFADAVGADATLSKDWDKPQVFITALMGSETGTSWLHTVLQMGVDPGFLFFSWGITQGKTANTGIMSTKDNETRGQTGTSLCCLFPVSPARLSSIDLSL